MKKIGSFTVLFLLATFLSANARDNSSLPAILALLLKSNNAAPVLGHQASIVGPLAEAQVNAYRLESPDVPAAGPIITPFSNVPDEAGIFDLSLAGVADNEWILVSVSQGKDIDHDGDGTVDANAKGNSGTIHTLAKAGDWKSRHLRVTPLTELAWRFTENLIPDISPTEIEIRLGDLARYLIKSDIDGNGKVDWYDILVFDPANPTHHTKLTTSYDWFTAEDEQGNSIIKSLLAGDENNMLSRMDELYTWLMTRFPAIDSRYNSVKLTLSVFGPGSASSASPSNLYVNSTGETQVYEDHTYLLQDDTAMVNFTAVAADGGKILSWTGCDTVSADLGTCTVSLDRSRSVTANFGYIETILTGTVHDLTRTTNILSPDSVHVQIPNEMADMIDELATAAVDDFIVGDDGGGFLRRITAITPYSSTDYLLYTAEASLEEIISQGTGYLFKKMENRDLEGYSAPAPAGLYGTVSPQAFTGIDGAYLVPSADPSDQTFTIVLGEPDGSMLAQPIPQPALGTSKNVVLLDDGNGHTLSAKGSINLDIDFDTGMNFGMRSWLPPDPGLKSFKFITILDITESVELIANAELAKFKPQPYTIGKINFNPIVFSIGPIPVWIQPSVDIYLFAEGKIGAKVSAGISFSQHIEGGLKYNHEKGFKSHTDFSSDYSPILPTYNIYASLRGGVGAKPAVKLYNTNGPALPMEAYLKIKGSASTVIYGSCTDVVVKFLAGAGVSFYWDLSGDTKIGKFLHTYKLENLTKFDIYTHEWPIFDWTLYDNCPFDEKGPHLLVEGNGITGTILEGDASGLSTNVSINNTGDNTLKWNTSGIPPEVSVSPSSGELAPGDTELVQISVSTAGLPTGQYLHEIFFYNEASVGSGVPDEMFGNTNKNIAINVLPLIPDTPVITSATSTIVGAVSLDWGFISAGSEPFAGFQIYRTQTPEIPGSFQLVSLTDISTRQATLYDFAPGSTHTFAIRAYTNSGYTGPFSDTYGVTFINTLPFTIHSVTSAGQVWMARNLGASWVATSMTDAGAYGDLYQWGRDTDGHEQRTSTTTSTISTSSQPGHGSFITPAASPFDWLSPQNDNLWSILNCSEDPSGPPQWCIINNPCPDGFRVPTESEWETERLSWSSNDTAGAFTSPLKLVPAGYRLYDTGTLRNVESSGFYWSSGVSGSESSFVNISGNPLLSRLIYESRAYGGSVRCIKDELYPYP